MNNMTRFTPHAQRVLSLAQEEAERLHHGMIDSEHLLLGILNVTYGIGSRVLRDLGIEPGLLQGAVKNLTMHSRTIAGIPQLSSQVKEVIKQSVDEAHRLGKPAIDTEHLLLALVRQTNGVAIEALAIFGVTPEAVRRQTRRVLQANPDQPTVIPQPLAPSKPVPEAALTEQASQAFFFARQYVDQFQLLTVDPEHVLIGLVREEYGVAGLILRDIGLQPKRVEDMVTKLTHAQPRTTETHPELSQKTKNVLKLAVDEAQRMGHNHIHTEHLLLGLLRQRESVVVDVLMRFGMSPDTLRLKTRRILHAHPLSTSLRQSSYERGTQAVSSNSVYLIESLIQAWMTTLLNQKELPDTCRIQITVSNRDSQEELYTLTLSLAEALAKLDQLLLATVHDNELESLDFESDTSPIRVELRIVNNKDKTDE